jgi:hypothetical protein
MQIASLYPPFSLAARPKVRYFSLDNLLASKIQNVWNIIYHISSSSLSLIHAPNCKCPILKLSSMYLSLPPFHYAWNLDVWRFQKKLNQAIVSSASQSLINCKILFRYYKLGLSMLKGTLMITEVAYLHIIYPVLSSTIDLLTN